MAIKNDLLPIQGSGNGNRQHLRQFNDLRPCTRNPGPSTSDDDGPLGILQKTNGFPYGFCIGLRAHGWIVGKGLFNDQVKGSLSFLYACSRIASPKIEMDGTRAA
jgi:hypothetical protein